jgi:hypothetical protein
MDGVGGRERAVNLNGAGMALVLVDFMSDFVALDGSRIH